MVHRTEAGRDLLQHVVSCSCFPTCGFAAKRKGSRKARGNRVSQRHISTAEHFSSLLSWGKKITGKRGCGKCKGPPGEKKKGQSCRMEGSRQRKTAGRPKDGSVDKVKGGLG